MVLLSLASKLLYFDKTELHFHIVSVQPSFVWLAILSTIDIVKILSTHKFQPKRKSIIDEVLEYCIEVENKSILCCCANNFNLTNDY